jgi:hypothetical protein
MKKVRPIIMLILTLMAITHLSVARHFCCGTEISSVISITGKTSGCGMENDKDNTPVNGLTFKNHCCENLITSCGTDNNYFPSFANNSITFQISDRDLFTATENISNLKFSQNSMIDNSPPWELLPVGVDLSDICILRI